MSQVAQLPAPLTSLVGREPDLRRIVDVLSRPETRHLTLAGAGGIGKTRLALAVARAVGDEFPDGVTFVELAPVSDAGLVDAAIAQRLGLSPDTHASTADALIDYYLNRSALLILDNFEHVMAAAPLVPRLLAECPYLVILVTSRERLGTTGEQVRQIEPLPLPPAATTSASRVIGSPAVRLFVERAAAARPGFVLTGDNAPDVAAICRRVDGMPLAIELAAARTVDLSPREIATNFERLLPLLEGGAPDQPARLRTMDDAVRWSYAMLTPEEQALFRRLSVFAGGCTIEAATEVGVRRSPAGDAAAGRSATDAGDDIDAILLLASLVDKSLLRFSNVSGAESRYTMLEPIREFGLAQLAALGQERDARRAHAEYFLDLAQRLRVELRDTEPGEWISSLEAEQDNFRAALRWLLDSDQGGKSLAVRISNELLHFWILRGRSVEARSWLNRAVEKIGDAQPDDVALAHLGMGRASMSNPREAFAVLERSLDLYRALRHQWGITSSLVSLGNVAVDLGRFEEARAYLGEGLALARESDDLYGVAQSSFDLGILMSAIGRFAEAKDYLDSARGIWEQLRDVSDVAFAIMALARVYRLEGRLDESSDLLDWSLMRLEQANIVLGQGMIHSELAEIALLRQDQSVAVNHFKTSLRLQRDSPQIDLRFVEPIDGLARILVQIRKPDLAVQVVAAIHNWETQTGFHVQRWRGVSRTKAMDAARHALGEQRFDAAWARGLRMSLIEAVTLVSDLDFPKFAPRPDTRLSLPRDVVALTRQEQRVICLIADGLSNQQIATALSITVRTSANHVTNILSKLGVENRTQAAALAMRNQLCAPA